METFCFYWRNNRSSWKTSSYLRTRTGLSSNSHPLQPLHLCWRYRRCRRRRSGSKENRRWMLMKLNYARGVFCVVQMIYLSPNYNPSIPETFLNYNPGISWNIITPAFLNIPENYNPSIPGTMCFVLFIVRCKNRGRNNKKQTLSVNTWKRSQTCGWETEINLWLPG